MISQEQILCILKEKQIKQLLPSKSLADIPTDMRLGDVLRLLAEKGLSAVPVYEISKENNRSYVGILSINDILAFTLFQPLVDQLEAFESAAEQQRAMEQLYQDLMQQESIFFNTCAGDLMGMTAESLRAESLNASQSIADLLMLFDSENLHRVLVFDDLHQHAMTMVTKTDLLLFLNNFAAECKELKTFWQAPVVAIEQYSREESLSTPASVVKVPASLSALLAFRAMHWHSISSVAIVDEQNRLVANLSASNLTGLTHDNLELLAMPVFQFLEKSHRSIGQLHADQLRVMHPSESIAQAVKLMLMDRIHHVWLVNEEEVPVGVVSISDILHQIVS